MHMPPKQLGVSISIIWALIVDLCRARVRAYNDARVCPQGPQGRDKVQARLRSCRDQSGGHAPIRSGTAAGGSQALRHCTFQPLNQPDSDALCVHIMTESEYDALQEMASYSVSDAVATYYLYMQ